MTGELSSAEGEDASFCRVHCHRCDIEKSGCVIPETGRRTPEAQPVGKGSIAGHYCASYVYESWRSSDFCLKTHGERLRKVTRKKFLKSASRYPATVTDRNMMQHPV